MLIKVQCTVGLQQFLIVLLRCNIVHYSNKIPNFILVVLFILYFCRIGVPGTFTQGHIDSKDNFAYQILGDKRWTIFSPQDYENLYYTKTKGSLEWSSALNSLEKPDLEKYPLYAKTNPISFVVHAGEVLYLPRGWTHFIENISPSLMINTWRYGPAAITELWSDFNKAEIRKKCF